MAEKLDIHVVVMDGQTVSLFAVIEVDGKVVFHNDANDELTVEFDQPLLCKGNDVPETSIVVAAGKKDTLKACPGAVGKQLKYTATVKDALPEDPIVIFESKKPGPEKGPINIFESKEFWGIGGLLIGLIAGYLIARRMMARDRPRP